MHKKHLIKEALFDFGKVSVIDNIVISEIKEGIVFNEEHNSKLLNFCHELFGDTAFGYISNRTHSYTVDPTVYLQSLSSGNMAAVAVVATHPSNKISVTIEKLFFNNPFETFNTLDQALDWMHTILNH